MNEQLISIFYTCLQKLDWKGMLDCYGEDVFFYDPVFENLEGPEVRAMWQMLLSRATDLELRFSEVQADDGYGSCSWIATYTFAATGRKVVNKGKARFSFSGGKIVEHQDEFNLWRWCSQALGLPGMLFGGTSLFQKKIRRNARQRLEKFMSDQPNFK